MKKSTIILLLLFLVLGGSTAWYMITKGDEKNATSTYDTSDREFAIENTDEIYKIFVADRKKGSTHTLTRNADDTWTLDGEYLANTRMVKLLLNTMKNLRLQSIPTAKGTENILQRFVTDQAKVEVYDKANKRIKTYYVGGTNKDDTGTYYLMENSTQPYIMEVPFFVGGLRTRYNINVQDWRSKELFTMEAADIQKVSVEYPKQKNKSFVIERKDGENFAVTPFYELTKAAKQPLNVSKTSHYFENFPEIFVEAYINDHPNREKVLTYVPFAKITVKMTDGTERTVDLYPRENRDRNGNLRSDTVDKYFGSLDNNTDMTLIQHRVIEQILWNYSTFFS